MTLRQLEEYLDWRDNVDPDKLGTEECDCGEDECPVCGGECWQCGGDGWGVIGDDWDSDDPINGPYQGEVQRCPCCGGSGKAKDCCYW